MNSQRSSTTPFSSAQAFVRALWGIPIDIHPLGNSTALRARFSGTQLWLPSTTPPDVNSCYSDYVLAATAHIAAHLQFGAGHFEVKQLKPAQVAIISLLEDARVEHLARATYPGLAQLFTPYHRAQAGSSKTSLSLFGRLARALHDADYVDDDAWVNKGRELFWQNQANWQNGDVCRHIGSALGNDLGQMRVQFNARDYHVDPAYRDDNTGLWQSEAGDHVHAPGPESDAARSALSDAAPPSTQPTVNERAPLPGTSRDRRPAGRHPCAAGNAPALSGVDISPRHASTAAGPAEASQYPEWDYVIARERLRFCTIRETPPELGDPTQLASERSRHGVLQRRLDRVAMRLVEARPRHVRRLLDGDRIDFPAFVNAYAATRAGNGCEARVYRRLRPTREAPALLLLLDLSESLNLTVPGASSSSLAVARMASALLARSLGNASVALAIHGFSSNGRHDVEYRRLLDFESGYDERAADAVLAGMRAARSTRLGTALRHAGMLLERRPNARKVLLVITDGEPSDVDVHDDQYLVLDAKQATVTNRARGILSFCFGLDQAAEPAIQRIFGACNYVVPARLEALAQQLAQLQTRLSA